MPDQHALLSASGAHRWMNCPPSALLEAALPDVDSEASQEGTAAHALGEWKIKRALRRKAGRKPKSRFDTEEMEEHTDSYRDYVLSQIKEVKKVCKDPVIELEQRLDFSDVVPSGFGTGDCVIIAEPVLKIIDLKYGAGVLVDAHDNPQGGLYALGALNLFDMLYDIEEVEFHIYQPRRDNYSIWSVTVEDLRTWAEEVVGPAAALAAEGEGEFKAGDWCQFCKLKSTCRARADENLALAQLEFKPGPELTEAEIADVLAQLPQLTKWAKDVQAYAQSAAINQGRSWPGFKLVEARTNRAYRDEAQVAQKAEEAGFTDIWAPKKLLGITALEKAMTRKRFAEVLGDLVIKPVGAPTLVPDADKRKAIETATAEQEFTAVNDK